MSMAVLLSEVDDGVVAAVSCCPGDAEAEDAEPEDVAAESASCASLEQAVTASSRAAAGAARIRRRRTAQFMRGVPE
ncbi:hypothetical protein [Streptomyces sp. 3N207]|uniref:hypothetical protein n=1 Tax=Streptomyces sp. 3N207 TaxID=3457417 RepID=UPI003FD0BF33